MVGLFNKKYGFFFVHFGHWIGQTHGVPGGPGCQLGLLQQHHILQATFGQVIGHAGPHAPAPDDDSVRGVLPPLSQSRGCITGEEERGERGGLTWELENAPCVKALRTAPTPHLSPASLLAVQPMDLTEPAAVPRQAAKSLRKCALSSCKIRDMAELERSASAAKHNRSRSCEWGSDWRQICDLSADSCPRTRTSSCRNFILFSLIRVNP